MTETAIKTDPVAVIRRIQDAINRHDLDAMSECFAPDYLSEQPGYPSRTFRGREQMRKNWSHIFAAVPDMQTHLLRISRDGDVVWSEWEHRGTGPDGKPHLTAMLTIQGIENDQVSWVRLYIVMQQEAGEAIDRAVEQHVGDGPKS